MTTAQVEGKISRCHTLGTAGSMIFGREKTIELWNAKRLARRGLEVLASAKSLPAAEKELAQTHSPVARFIAAAAGETHRSDGFAPEGVKDRAAILLSRIEAQAGRAITRGIGVLATIGATAPFVGLFGTVWGIMDSFIGISKTSIIKSELKVYH